MNVAGLLKMVVWSLACMLLTSILAGVAVLVGQRWVVPEMIHFYEIAVGVGVARFIIWPDRFGK